ncbi:hypothetical protein PVAP13_3NG277041 [Panicum virgatum]|uniref:Reverse transcriptase zinc-binding domain-containing protein n=1 Tax=Panicum virgatum TaxID=38727 RepID=A0A8T0UI60_PANVG|nr:hypothetical protein PVAP13_3NG277041 [Panicum virgatum]
MNISPDLASQMASALGCSISSFPQPYLGLPLTVNKVRLSDLQPLIDRFDKYFAGWRGSLLNQAGREVLVRSVLSSFPIYAMCSILLPKGVLDILDSKRRAFLWTGSTSCTGASCNCKAPWDLVCLPKEKGGLGIPDLPVQNKCLLNKFLVKLLAPSSAPWHMWFSAKYSWSASCDLGDDRYTDTAVWRGIRDGLSDFRSATSVQVGSGLSTFFWMDQWLGGDTLAATFPGRSFLPLPPTKCLGSYGNVQLRKFLLLTPPLSSHFGSFSGA